MHINKRQLRKPAIRRPLVSNYHKSVVTTNITTHAVEDNFHYVEFDEYNLPEDAIIVTKGDLEPKSEVISDVVTENNEETDVIVQEEEVKPKKRRTKKVSDTEENKE